MIKRDKTDALFSRYIKLLSGGYCARCKKYFGIKSRGLHCAHYFTRGKRTVRFDKDNACALCYYDHIHLDHNPLEKQEFFRNLLGNKRFDALVLRAHKPIKIDVEAIQADLKEKIGLLEE